MADLVVLYKTRTDPGRHASDCDPEFRQHGRYRRRLRQMNFFETREV